MDQGTSSELVKIYDIILGQSAATSYLASDAVFLWRFQRHTLGPGTGGTVTPQLLDLADSSSTNMTLLNGLSTNPTLTANAFLLHVPLNQRMTFRWLAVQGGEMVLPATGAGNGITILTPTASDTSATVQCMIHYETGGG